MNLLKRAKHYARTAVRIVKSTRQRKLLIRQKLVEHSDKMAPGLYIIGFRTAHRLFSPMPPTLKASKTSRLAPQIYPIASRLIYTFDSRFPPNFHYIPKTSTSPSEGDTTLFVSADRNAKTFNLKRSAVTTYFDEQAPILRLKEAHRALSPSLPIPTIRTDLDQLAIEEPFLSGIPFSAAPLDLQIVAYHRLLKALTKHIRGSNRSFMSEDQAQHLIDVAWTRSDLPGSLRAAIQDDIGSLMSLLTNCPLVDSHRDLHAANILIDKDSIALIDLEHTAPMPFFYDALLLPLNEAYKKRPYILNKYDRLFQQPWHQLLHSLERQTEHSTYLYFLATLITHLAQDIPRGERPERLWQPIIRRWPRSSSVMPANSTVAPTLQYIS